jgi:hypothetical protein
VNVSPDNSGTIKRDGLPVTTYPAVLSVAGGVAVILEAVPASGYTFSHWSGSVTGTTNPTVILDFDSDKTVTANFTPPSSAMSKLYFPHVASQVGSSPDIWETEICVINTSNHELSGTLKSYRGNGQVGIISNTITIAPHERWSRIVGNGEFTNPSEIGYMIFESVSSSVVGYTKFFIAGKYRAAIPAVKEVNTSDIYIPHIASDADWWTAVSLVNTTPVEKGLTITFNNGDSRPINLGAREHKAFNIAQEFFNNQPQPNIQSAVITNASDIIGLELFGRNRGGDQLDGILLTDKTASTLYYPHVDNDGWWTGIVAYNPSELACTITITPYSVSGILLTPKTDSIPGKGKYVGIVAELGLPAETAWFKIESTAPLSGFELFSTSDNSQLAAYTGGGGIGAMAGVFPKIEKDGGWTGIAFVNTESVAASVTLTAYRDNGTVVATGGLPPVVGHAKVVNLAEVFFFPQDISAATYIGYSSDKNVVGFQLNGSSDGKMLDGLPALGGTP